MRVAPVVGYEGLYEILVDGRVFSVPRGRPVALQTHYSGHINASLWRDGQRKVHYVHRLVLIAFVGPCPPGMQCRHMNGVHSDNRVENLRWGTHGENTADSMRHGATARGRRVASAKLNEDDVREIRASGLTCAALALMFGISPSHISGIRGGKYWNHVSQ